MDRTINQSIRFFRSTTAHGPLPIHIQYSVHNIRFSAFRVQSQPASYFKSLTARVA